MSVAHAVNASREMTLMKKTIGTSNSRQITLYSYEFSPFAAKVRCFLGYKNLSYQTHYVHPLRARAEIPLGHQVPVIRVDDELRNDSTPIGIFLDEKFPQQPLLPLASTTQRNEVLAVDSWVTAQLVPLCFRLMLGHNGGLGKQLRNGSIGANGVHQTVNGGYPLLLRWLHPLLVPRAKFIREITNGSDQSKTNRQLLAETCTELSAGFTDHPFLARQQSATLADLSAFAQLALPYLAGYDDVDEIEQYPLVMQWLSRMQGQLPADAGLRQDLHRREITTQN